jgi:hypothetical protein
MRGRQTTVARPAGVLVVLSLACNMGSGDAPARTVAATSKAAEPARATKPATPPPGGCEFKDPAQFCACLGHTCGGDTLPDKNGVYHTVYCGTCDPTQVCLAKPTVAGGAAGSCAAIPGLTPPQKKIAEQLTSLWENDTTTVDYGYSEDIKDGRGFTSGRAGFCTGTGDAIVVVACYDSIKPGNRLEKHMPALAALEEKFVRSLGKANQGAVTTLPGWVADWGASAQDPSFRGCQDGVVDAVYYGAAMQHAAEKGFRTALVRAALYDAQINMGEDNPDYGVKAMMAKADRLTGPMGTPPTPEQESTWLGHFLRVRAHIMYADAHTWRTNMYRVAAYEKLRRAGNLDLEGCIRTGTSAAAMWPRAGFPRTPGPSAKLGNCGPKSGIADSAGHSPRTTL